MLNSQTEFLPVMVRTLVYRPTVGTVEKEGVKSLK